jgi:methyl-accepting chemotaxis protein
VGTVPTLDWYIAVITPLTIWDYLGTTMTALFLAMIVIILVIFAVFFLFISGLLKPLNIMVAALDEISGNWDLTRRLNMKQQDETGNLAGFFNITFERMGGLIQNIKSKVFTLIDTSDELSSTMDEASQAIGMINEDIQDMHRVVLTQTEGVNSSTASMEHIITGLDKLNSHVAVQVEAVAQSSSAVEEMLANISSVTDTLKKNAENISSLAESSETGRQDLQKISQDIQDIAKESEGLLEINSVMQNIASQTNLLSMNAAIEAAHAGESGKGFAVVADEIRKLAENSGVQSKTISTVLKKIKSSIDTITKSTSVVLEHFSAIEQEVNGVSIQEAHIRNAMEEQGVGSRHILDAITRLNSVTGEVERDSSAMSKTSKEVLKETGSLKHINGNVAKKMDDMTQRTTVITAAVTKVHEISRKNKENISLLSSEIARFKV